MKKFLLKNLRKYLNDETIKLNLEHHNWLKDSLLNKLGKMAPNLQQLSLRRLAITDDSFGILCTNLNHIECLDISDCYLIQEGSFIKFLENNGKSLQRLSASNCIDAITDKACEKLANIESVDL